MGSTVTKTDALVIGFGKGGKTLAGALAAAGQRVVLAERSAEMYGGTCINVACIPTKALAHSAKLSAAQGGSFEEKAERYRAAVERKDALVARLRDKNYHKLADHPGITVLTGEASFVGPRRVEVRASAGTEELEADRVFINTGARPYVPSIPGLEGNRRVYVSESMMALTELPRRLLIVGGGYIGVEFASMYANFGASVTMVQDGKTFLPREDAEVARAVLEHLEGRGVRVVREGAVREVREAAGCAVAVVDTPEGAERLEAEAVLVATGRRPNVEGLNLKAAGIELTPRGAIQTDEHLRTSAPGVWAMGDVTGGLQFTYVSLDDSRVVRSDVLGDGSRTTENRGAIPYSVFLDPPFSRVGLTEQEARDAGYEVKVARLSVSAVPKAQVMGSPAGLLKAVIDAGTDRVLGAHLFCEESHELINLAKLAIDAGIAYPALRDAVYTHPTMSEALNDLFAGV